LNQKPLQKGGVKMTNLFLLVFVFFLEGFELFFKFGYFVIIGRNIFLGFIFENNNKSNNDTDSSGSEDK